MNSAIVPPLPQIETIVEAFFPDARVLTAYPIGTGLINETIKVVTNYPDTMLTLQRINTSVFKNPTALMRNFALVTAHLQEKKHFPLLIPTPYSTTDKELCYRDQDDHYWRISPYFDHTYAPETLPDTHEAYEAARAYGIFLESIADLPLNDWYVPLPGFHDTTQRYVFFREALQRDPAGRVRLVQREIAQLLEAEQFAIQIQALLNAGQLPLRPVHNDTKAGNVLLFKNTGKAAAVIDWDTIMPGSVLSDYGDMVRTFVPDNTEDAPADELAIRTDILHALQEGFLETSQNLLTPTERAHLPLGAKWIIGEQALRFLTDYILGDTYYKVKYPEHNLVRARNQIRLLELVCALAY